MTITYPLRFALELSPDERAFCRHGEDVEMQTYFEVDMQRQVILRSCYTVHDECEMDGARPAQYEAELTESGLPLDHGWLPLMKKGLS